MTTAMSAAEHAGCGTTYVARRAMDDRDGDANPYDARRGVAMARMRSL